MDEDPLAGVGDSPWLVLGGGGIKGMVHVGAWRWLREQGHRVHGVIGCSIGALVAACIAAGMDVSRMHGIARRLRRPDIVRINRRAAWVNGIKTVSVFRGTPLREYVERILPVRDWDELELPLQVNAVDLRTGDATWFGTGARTDVPLIDAIYASAALPVFYPPASIAGSHFVDGGLFQALPFDRALATEASGIIVVDAGSGAEVDPDTVVEQGMIAIHQRVMSIMIRRRRQELIERGIPLPMILVRPQLEGYGTFDFDSIPYFLEAGYRATRLAIPPAKET